MSLAVFTRRAVIGIRNEESTTTRIGSLPSTNLQFNIGSSSRTVCDPTIMAIYWCLSSWTSFLDASQEIHCDSPLTVAILPSNDMADLYNTKGSLFTIYFIKISLSLILSSARTPVVTSIPALRIFSIPRPATNGFGSSSPTTTRPIFFSIILSAQGGVLP